MNKRGPDYQKRSLSLSDDEDEGQNESNKRPYLSFNSNKRDDIIGGSSSVEDEGGGRSSFGLGSGDTGNWGVGINSETISTASSPTMDVPQANYSNAAQKMMDDLKCEICSNSYDDGNHRPKSLPCGHTYCKHCMAKEITKGKTSCPTCCQPHNAKSVADLPMNVILERLIRNMPKSLSTSTKAHDSEDEETKEYDYSGGPCSTHKKSFVYFFCETHSLMVCRECTVLDHPVTKCKIISFMEEIKRRKDDKISQASLTVTAINDTLSALGDFIKEKNKIIYDQELLITIWKKQIEDATERIGKEDRAIGQAQYEISHGQVKIKDMEAEKQCLQIANTKKNIDKSSNNIETISATIMRWISHVSTEFNVLKQFTTFGTASTTFAASVSSVKSLFHAQRTSTTGGLFGFSFNTPDQSDSKGELSSIGGFSFGLPATTTTTSETTNKSSTGEFSFGLPVTTTSTTSENPFKTFSFTGFPTTTESAVTRNTASPLFGRLSVFGGTKSQSGGQYEARQQSRSSTTSRGTKDWWNILMPALVSKAQGRAPRRGRRGSWSKSLSVLRATTPVRGFSHNTLDQSDNKGRQSSIGGISFGLPATTTTTTTTSETTNKSSTGGFSFDHKSSTGRFSFGIPEITTTTTETTNKSSTRGFSFGLPATTTTTTSETTNKSSTGEFSFRLPATSTTLENPFKPFPISAGDKSTNTPAVSFTLSNDTTGSESGLVTSKLDNPVESNTLSPESPNVGSSIPSKEDGEVKEYEPLVYFKSVSPLPELVEVKTGEETEEVLFCEQSKLSCYDKETKEWKERGLGKLKILKNKETSKVFILMRREQINKICANHFITPEITLNPMISSDKAWVWDALDFADEVMKVKLFAANFKSAELAKKFHDTFEKAKNIVKGSSKGASIELDAKECTSDSTDSNKSSSTAVALLSSLAQFKSTAGT